MGETAAGFVRSAGRARLADGDLLVWSVAEGRRGRRWRATISRDGLLRSVLLLELSTDGGPRRLELGTTAGMLTLHPEPDRQMIDGNVVSADGVRPLALPWSPEHALDVVGNPIAAGAIVHRLASLLAVGDGAELPVVSIDERLVVGSDVLRVERQADDRWLVQARDGAIVLTLSPNGVPEFEAEGTSWPLEE